MAGGDYGQGPKYPGSHDSLASKEQGRLGHQAGRDSGLGGKCQAHPGVLPACCDPSVTPFKRVFAFGPEVVHVGLEVQLEHVVLVDVLGLRGNGERVPEQRQAGKGMIVLERGTKAAWGGGRWHWAWLLPPSQSSSGSPGSSTQGHGGKGLEPWSWPVQCGPAHDSSRTRAPTPSPFPVQAAAGLSFSKQLTSAFAEPQLPTESACLPRGGCQPAGGCVGSPELPPLFPGQAHFTWSPSPGSQGHLTWARSLPGVTCRRTGRSL